ncbi:MAG: hypothetical protein ACYC5Y_05245 [Symbiobacteriia bacterium]
MSHDPSATPVALTQRPLAANETYTQPGRSRITVGSVPPAELRGIVYADQAGTLYVEESNDGLAWTQTATLAVAAGALADTGWVSLSKRDYRFRYVNGAVAQTSFTLFQASNAGVTLTRSTLTGSNVTLPTAHVGSYSEVSIHAALAITDTAVHWAYGLVDTAEAVAVYIFNALNQAVDITLGTGFNTADTVNAADKTNAPYKITVPASSLGVVITPADWPPLRYVKYVALKAQCAVAPTSGSLGTKALVRK